MEHPKAPSARKLWKGRAMEAVLAFLEDTRVRCISTRRKPSGEECDGEDGEEECDGEDGEEECDGEDGE